MAREIVVLKQHNTGEAFAASVLNNLEAAICLTDASGYFYEVSEAYCKLYGYEARELVGKHFTMMVPEAYRAGADELHRAFIAGEEELPKQWTVQDRAGNPMQVYVHAFRAEKDGKPAKMTLVEPVTAS
jgi:PAS domain S-box-containing protein